MKTAYSRLLIPFLLTILSFSPLGLRADQTFTVTTNADSGAGSLRWALTEPCTGTRTVNFGFYDTVIELSSSIVVTGNVAIIAQEHGASGQFLNGGRITISGGGSVRPFVVSPGAAFRLQGLTVANGSAEEGGAIYNDGGDLRVVRCTLLNNAATRGGAIYNNGGSNVLNTCTLSGNTATRGGVVYNDGGSSRLQYVTACENSASELGGVLYTDGGSDIVHRSILWGNAAPACATAPAYSTQIADANSAMVSATQCIIQGGYPGYYDSTGLGVWDFAKDLIQEMPYNLDVDPLLGPLGYPKYSGDFQLFTADWEKDNANPVSTMMYEPLPGSPAHFAIYGFYDNDDWLEDPDDVYEQRGSWLRRKVDGGNEVYGASIGSCFIGFQNPYIIGEHPHYEIQTNDWGEAMWETNTSQSTEVLQPFQPIRMTVTSPYCPPISYEGGEVFFVIPDTPTGPSCTISPNPAKIAADGTVTFTPIANGYVGTYTVIAHVLYHPPYYDYLAGKEITLTNTKGQHLIVTNEAADSTFGSLRWATENVAEGGRITFAGDLTCPLTQQSGKEQPTVLYDIDGEDNEVVITAQGTASVMTVGRGGSPSPITIQNVTIADGYFSDAGFSFRAGGAYIRNGYISFINVKFRNNRGDNGGALSIDTISHLDGALNLKLINCVFEGNRASNRGGALFLVDSDAEIDFINCTFTGNQAAQGGAIYNQHPGFFYLPDGMRQRFSNCIFWDNTATTYPTIHTEAGGGSNSVTFTTSDIPNAFPSGTWDAALGINGGGNIAADPLFTDAANSNYVLAAGSPCINAGSNGLVPTNITEDIAGNQRMADSIVDMGAYETPYIVTVTFNANGGTPGTISSNYVEGLAIGVLPVVTRTGYTFSAWTNAAGAMVTTTTLVSRTATNLYARWTANTYAVTFDKQSGTGGSNGVTATYGSAMPTATAPTRTGYTFGGYWDAPSDGTQYYSAAMASLRTWDKATASTLYARWTANTSTVAYNGNGSTGGVTASSEHTYDTASPLTLNGFTRDGYTFIGWNTAANGRGTSYFDGATILNLTDVNGASVTLYAQWAPYGTTRDQINDNVGNYFLNLTSGWQSFTAGTDGYLAAVSLYVYSYGAGSKYSGGPDWTGTLAIYAGTGTGGALLASQPISGTGAVQLPTFFLDPPPKLAAGGVYTLAILNASAGLTFRASANLYAGGRCGFNAGYDLDFATYLMASDWSDAAFRDTSFTVDMNVISNAAQLAQFAWLVNNGEMYLDRTITLVSDIHLAAHYWVPAGPGFSQRFEGAFDGAGHSVSGLRIDNPAADYQGLFGCVGTEGAVRNLTVADSEISGQTYVGGIAGRSFGIISNCTVTAGGTISGTLYSVGGVVGCAEGALYDCVNGAAVTGGGGVGGVAGEANGTITNCTNSGSVLGNSSVGGIAGIAIGTLADCMNSGSVEATGGEATGGVAGSAAGDILQCTNTGSVEGGLAAGIVGQHTGERIDGCRNAGAVTAMAAGGIVTMGQSLVVNCVNEGTVYGVMAGGIVCELHEGAVVRNCANAASIEGMSAAGGFAASTEVGSVIENCVNSGAVTGSGDVGGLIATHEGAATNCYWKQTGIAPFTLPVMGTDNGTLAACQSFGDAPGTLAAPVTVGGVMTDRLSSALNAWVAAAWMPGCGLSSWTAGSSTSYPSLVPAIELGGALIPQTLGDGFMAGADSAQIAGTVAAYTNAHPTATASTFGGLLCQADAMGFSFADLAAGDAILRFDPYLIITGFDPFSRVLTFQLENGVDMTATVAMNRLAGSSSGLLRVYWMGRPDGIPIPLTPTVEFREDGRADATFDISDPQTSAFFRLVIEQKTD